MPQRVAAYLGMLFDEVGVVHERGNLEFNGVDTVILNWSALVMLMNPGDTRTQARPKALVRRYRLFCRGARGRSHQWSYRWHRKIYSRRYRGGGAVHTAPVCKPVTAKRVTLDSAAQVISDAGFTVIESPWTALPVDGCSRYQLHGWLVGNGFVITTGYGDERLDDEAKVRLQTISGRDIYVLLMLKSWAAGGGVHCHTNDQPAYVTVESSLPFD